MTKTVDVLLAYAGANLTSSGLEPATTGLPVGQRATCVVGGK